ncbi:MAG: alpha/beta hydrolase [Brevinema sp.]
MKKIKSLWFYQVLKKLFQHLISGSLVYMSIPSAILGIEWKCCVYLPRGFSKKQQYSLMYLLHDGDGSEKSWIDKGNILKLLDLMIFKRKMKPTIVVFPQATINSINTYYIDSSIYRMQSALEKELFPYIEETFPIKQDPLCRSIGGVSMGGYGALRLALSNPQYFGSVMCFSPAVWIQMSDERIKRMENKTHGIFGVPFNPKRWDELNYPILWKNDPPLFKYVEVESFGHDWESWREQFVDAIQYIFR